MTAVALLVALFAFSSLVVLAHRWIARTFHQPLRRFYAWYFVDGADLLSRSDDLGMGSVQQEERFYLLAGAGGMALAAVLGLVYALVVALR